MAVNFNHTIVYARDSRASATFLAEMLGLPEPKAWGPFQVVTTDNGANIDFMHTDGPITPQHYAFLVGEAEFEECSRVSAGADCAIGPTRRKRRKTRSTITMAAAARISKIRTAISWRSSRVRTVAAAGTAEAAECQLPSFWKRSRCCAPLPTNARRKRPRQSEEVAEFAGGRMIRMLQDVVGELEELPPYFQERAAKRIWAVFREVETEMVLWDHEAKTRYETAGSMRDGRRV